VAAGVAAVTPEDVAAGVLAMTPADIAATRRCANRSDLSGRALRRTARRPVGSCVRAVMPPSCHEW
jgi:hypothetical protein